jgi:galactonate dehydratase
MKVSAVKTFLVYPYSASSSPAKSRSWLRKHWLLVKVQTDDGAVGWGEAYTQAGREKSIAQHVANIASYLIGSDPFHIRHFARVVYEDVLGKRGAMDAFCAMSGIEQALWDIIGKRLGVPVYNLLGGPCRKRIRVYANGWSYGGLNNEPDELAEKALQTVKMGFTALKFDPFTGPWRPFISREDEKSAVRRVQVVREAVGPDIDILIEVHRRLAPMHATRVASMMEEFNPFWYEEPMSADNIDALAGVKRAIRIPVVTGETLYTKSAFREVLEKQAADILNPDVASCGGILELTEIAAMAAPYYVAMSPHNYNSTTVALAATIQAASVMPNFLITEYFVNFAEMGNAISVNPLRVEGGYIALPTAPGLGLEIEEAALEHYPFRDFPQVRLRTYADEGP